MWEAVLGPEHPHTATRLNNLGSLLQVQGDLAGARPYYERALAIAEAVLGLQHPYTATSLNNLGLLLQAQGDTLYLVTEVVGHSQVTLDAKRRDLSVCGAENSGLYEGEGGDSNPRPLGPQPFWHNYTPR
jgi:tetratricopeptide (TPR) repeat protein